MLRNWLIGAASMAAAALGFAPLAGAQVVADFEDDWDAARANGLGIVGADDTPEQGHPDTAGSGRWFYREVNGATFAQTDLVWDEGLDVYDRANTGGFEVPFIGRDNTHPQGTTQFSNRIWNTFLPAGTPIRITGSVDVVGGAGSNGVQFVLIRNNDVATPLVDQIVAEGPVFTYDITTTLPDNGAAGNFFNFALGPNGADSFDTTSYTATISIVPEPAAGLLLGAGALGLLVRRGRRR